MAVAQWSIAQVVDWVTEAGHGDKAEIFRKEEIDGETLVELKASDFQELGFPKGPAMKLAKRIAELQAGTPAQLPAQGGSPAAEAVSGAEPDMEPELSPKDAEPSASTRTGSPQSHLSSPASATSVRSPAPSTLQGQPSSGGYPQPYPPPPQPHEAGSGRRGEVRQTRVVLTSEEKERVLMGINMDLPIEKIIRLFGEATGSMKANALEEFHSTLMRPPKPHPIGCKVLTVKSTGPVLPLYHYKCSYDSMKRYYTMLVIGATGTGKTTLLDAFVNCLCGQEYADNWRWRLVDESAMEGKHGSESQTEEITCYHISDVRGNEKGPPCHVKIIDTPGFGDTRGPAADEAIVKKFEHLFKHEVHELDCVLLVVKAGESRWTSSNRYVYDRIQEMFGKDAESRFVLMCTHADGAPPPGSGDVEASLEVPARLPLQQLGPLRPLGQGHTADEVLLEDGHGECGQLLEVRRADLSTPSQPHTIRGSPRPPGVHLCDH